MLRIQKQIPKEAGPNLQEIEISSHLTTKSQKLRVT